VTGSSRLDIFRRTGDSLMGRYLLYRMNPWSVGECIRTEAPSHEIYPPAKLSERDWDALWEHGGFPEPFLRRDARFTNGRAVTSADIRYAIERVLTPKTAGWSAPQIDLFMKLCGQEMTQ